MNVYTDPVLLYAGAVIDALPAFSADEPPGPPSGLELRLWSQALRASAGPTREVKSKMLRITFSIIVL